MQAPRYDSPTAPRPAFRHAPARGRHPRNHEIDPPLLRRVIHEQGGSVEEEVRACMDRWKRSISGVRGPRAATGPARPSGHSPASLHTCYPFLFHGAFPEVAWKTVRELAVADRMYTEHLLGYDRALDRPDSPYPGSLFVAQLEQSRSLRHLARNLPPGSPFWDFFRDCHQTTWASVQEEWLWQLHRLGPVSLTRFLGLAKGKTSLLKPCTAALAFLAQRDREHAWISRVLDEHHAGLVLLDDLEDWKEDFLRGNYTFLLARVIRRGGLRENILWGETVPLRRVASLLYGTGEAERQLRWAEGCFRKALQTPSGTCVPLWKALNLRFLVRCRNTRHGIQKHRKRIPLQAGAAPAGQPPAITPEPVRVLLHPSMPERLAAYAARIATPFGSPLPGAGPQEIHLGHWTSMPAHFCARDGRLGRCAVNLARPVRTPLESAAHNLLRVEIVLALVSALRHRLHGPGAGLADHLYTRGLGFWICKVFWPGKPENLLLRMTPLHWTWCVKHERQLWEKMEPLLLTRPAAPEVFLGIHRPPDPSAACGLPGKEIAFLGFRFFCQVRARGLCQDIAHDLQRKPASLPRELRRYLQR
jgi:hypothetical protein